MGTSNYYNKNASRIFSFAEGQEDQCPYCESEDFKAIEYGKGDTIGDTYKCDSCGKTFDDPIHHDSAMDYEFTRDNIFHELKKVCEEKKLHIVENNGYNGERNFGGRYLCEISKTHPKYNSIGIQVSITCLSRSGYYDGANMDWEIGNICIGNGSWDEVPDPLDIAHELQYMGKGSGIAKIQSRNIEKWVERTVDELVKLIEDVYEQFTDPLIRVATFSNGETIYKRVNEKEHGDVSVV